MKQFTLNKVTKFTDKGEKIAKKAKKRLAGILRLFLILLGIGLGFFLFYKVSQFYDSNKVVFQNPILLRTPIYVEKRKPEVIKVPIVVTPTPTPKPRSEIKPIPKYLTDQGFKNREFALKYLSKYYNGDELIAADNLLKSEAGYRTDAINEYGCGGIPQACPATKMGCPLDQSGLQCQLQWFVGYINSHGYGSPLVAWNYHLVNNSY